MAKDANAQRVAAAPEPQPELDFGVAVKARHLWLRALEGVRSVVSRRGPKETAFDLDVAPTTLHDALAERDRKALRAEQFFALLLTANDSELELLLRDVLAACGYELKRRRRSPEEELARLEQRIRETFGKAGEQLLAEVRR